jgi:hypothetical protein
LVSVDLVSVDFVSDFDSDFESDEAEALLSPPDFSPLEDFEPELASEEDFFA